MSTTNQEKPLTAKEILFIAVKKWSEIDEDSVLKCMNEFSAQQVSAATKEKDEEISGLKEALKQTNLLAVEVRAELKKLKSKQLTPERIAELMPSDDEITSRYPEDNTDPNGEHQDAVYEMRGSAKWMRQIITERLSGLIIMPQTTKTNNG